MKLQSSIRSAQSQIICLKQISVNSGVRTQDLKIAQPTTYK